jgi:hypothetical protein
VHDAGGLAHDEPLPGPNLESADYGKDPYRFGQNQIEYAPIQLVPLSRELLKKSGPSA